MRWLPVLMLLLLGIVCAAGADPVRITEFCPDPYLHDDTDEYLVISGHGPLDGITVSDAKGGFRFPPDSPTGTWRHLDPCARKDS